MKKLIWSLLAIAILMGGGYYYYTEYYVDKDPDAWDLVPANALLVYESDQVVRVWNRVNQLEFFKNLMAVPFFQDLNDNILHLDSLAGMGGQLDRALTGREFLMSVHVVSKDELGYLFLIPLDRGSGLQVMDRIRSSIHYPQESRTYQGFEIEELRAGENTILALARIGDIMVGSFTPLLVEDAIREVAMGGDPAGFKEANFPLFQLAKLENDQGNLYVNTHRLGQLLTVFGVGSGLPTFGRSTFLDLSVSDKEALLTGFTVVDESQADQFLNVFDGVSPGSIKMDDLLPDRTSFLMHLTFEQPDRFKSNLLRYLKSEDPTSLHRRDSLNRELDTDLSKMMDWFGPEIALIILESINIQNPQRLVVVGTSDPAESLNQLNRLAESINSRIQDSLYRETFGQVPITQLYVDEFPRLLLGPLFQGFESCFFAPVNEYVVFGNSIEAIKILLNDVNLENTWGKSVAQSTYLDNIVSEANLSLIVSTRNHWNSWMDQLQPAWSEYFQRYRGVFRDYDRLALQFGYIDDKYYTSVDIHYSISTNGGGEPTRFDITQDVVLDTLLTTKPFVVRSHIDRSFETLVQDSNNSLIFLSSEGLPVWTNVLPGPIVGSVFQIDYFKNGKLQYLFATADRLHLLDRNGQAVEGYPLKLDSGVHVDRFSVIDYDQNGTYRFLLSDLEGRVYMFNKERENLEGWQGKPMGGRLSSPPFHLRVRNRDCLVFGLENGKIYITNRRGELFPGFPLEFESPIVNPIFAETGSSFANTQFSTITNDGEMVKFNLSGEITNRIQFYKPSQEVLFQIVPDALDRTFIIARQELNRLSILNPRGELIFEKDYLTSRQMNVQFYSFGSDDQFYAVTDPEQEFTYLYDHAGDLINFQPIESGFQIGLLKRAGDEYSLYGNYRNRALIYGFKY